jgi:hypothetical protein
VGRLVSDLRDRYVDVWFAGDALRAGVFWRDEIRRAISAHDFFIACFSDAYAGRHRTYMNEELETALQEIRMRGSAPWFIPVLLSGDVPDREIGAGRTLRDIQFVHLSEQQWREGMQNIMFALRSRTERTRHLRLSSPGRVSFQGRGSGTTERFHLDEGLWFAAVGHGGSEPFVVSLTDERGNCTARLADLVIGDTNSPVYERTYISTLFAIRTAGLFSVDVTASAGWVFRIERPVRVSARAILQGDLPLATNFYPLEASDYTFRITYQGSAHISVILHAADGQPAYTLADNARASVISVNVPLSSGDYAFAVDAVGRWEIAWGRA